MTVSPSTSPAPSPTEPDPDTDTDTDAPAPEPAAPPGLLHRAGRWCARRPWWVIAAWLLVMVATVAANHAWGGTYEDDFSLPDSSVQTGADLMDTHSSDAVRGVSSQIVLEAESGALADHRGALDKTAANLADLPDVLSVADPLRTPGALSKDGAIGYFTIWFEENPVTFDHSYVDEVDAAVADLRADDVTVEYGGSLGQLARPEAAEHLSEFIGLATAVIVLLIGFGSVAAALVPILTAVVSLLAGISLLGLLAAMFTFGAAPPSLAIMMGLGVGLDYALFLATRFRGLLQKGSDQDDPAEVVGRTVATSGRAVLVAAATVAMALAGLYASGVTFIGTLGAAAGITVVVAALASLTLTPAVLGLAGRRVDRWAVRTPVAEPTGDNDVWHRWASTVRRRPRTFLTAGALLLGVLSIPLGSIRLGHVDAGANPADYTDRRAYDLIAEGFGPGANGQFTVVVNLGDADPASVSADLTETLAGTDGVAEATPPAPTVDDALLISTVIPEEGPEEESTFTLLHELQDEVLPEALDGSGAEGYVTGKTAAQLTFRDVMVDRLPLIIAVVVGAAFLLLLTVFRSVLIAVKAALLNLLSIAAAYGVVVAVFQWQWGSSWFGVTGSVPVESYVPMMMFAIVFGLSMDYEVFLLSRVREAWLETGDNHRSVATGLAATARVITCAAIIMTSVFLASLLSTNVLIKMLALGLGVSVIIDATVVRLLLVPASMYLFGRANWWMPRWLDRLLPHVDPEGRP
ncbi:MMPL family transporter [Streptomyces sp. MUM 203J]|uniref:MMPL family transporter n=1 Tax=Streptomyces sp. MUM 203J TaxID=2791990 RepID=UPI001F0445EF|nr:MMPL family transporter [Streptomyces sp. MUM 203J]MCH0542004.1 MMPL family transporter [Streptomyces sp. MUM 203J]